MPIFKTTLTITVFHEEDTLVDAENHMCNMKTINILQEMDNGEFIGITHLGESVEVPPQALKMELEKIGGDNTFFDLDDRYQVYKSSDEYKKDF